MTPTRRTCLICHALPHRGRAGIRGTSGHRLHGIARRYTEGELRLRLVDPKTIQTPRPRLPSYYARDAHYRVAAEYRGRSIYSASEIEDVIAYPADPARRMTRQAAAARCVLAQVFRYVVFSVALYNRLESETGMSCDWNKVGSLRLSASRNRVLEAGRLVTMARSFGLAMHVVTPSEAKRTLPRHRYEGP